MGFSLSSIFVNNQVTRLAAVLTCAGAMTTALMASASNTNFSNAMMPELEAAEMADAIIPPCANTSLSDKAYIAGCVGDVLRVLREGNGRVRMVYSPAVERNIDDITKRTDLLAAGTLSVRDYLSMVRPRIAKLHSDIIAEHGDWDSRVAVAEIKDILGARAAGQAVAVSATRLQYD